MLLLTLPAFLAMLPRSLPEVSFAAAGGIVLWGIPSIWGLGSLPAPPQCNPFSFPQYKTKFHCIRRKSQNHNSVFTMPLSNVCARETCRLYPASACQGSHPTDTACVLVLSATGGAGYLGCGLAHHPSRATHRRFMLCHCLQRSVLRPYYSFLVFIVLSELKCCILFLTKSCLLSWLLYSSPHPSLSKIFKDKYVCSFVILKNPFYPFEIQS